MKPLLALLALLLVAAADPLPPCSQPAEHRCSIGDRSQLQLRDGIATRQRIIRIEPSALPFERPLTVRFAGLASAEFYWNGTRIGRNGVPGADPASEIAGQYFATFTVPPALLRAGNNMVEARLSGQHLWLPVEHPVHILDVGPYETPELPGRTSYLPALLALGTIGAAFAYFLVLALGGGPPASRLVAGFALAAMLQLIAEVSRAFVSFSYPWALGRVAAIAALAAVAAVLMAAYSAQRFIGGKGKLVIAGTTILAVASLILVPWFDFKAMGALLAGAIALGGASVIGIRQRIGGARWGAAISLVTMTVMVREFTGFLDMGWHLIAAAALVLLVLEQLGQVRHARLQGTQIARLEERLRKAEQAGEPILSLKDGSRTHRVAESDILYVRAADDYCEVRLVDGRNLLVTMGLSRLQAFLPPVFVRVHKSYIVNASQVRGIAPRPGGGKLIKLAHPITIPVGRSYSGVVRQWEAAEPAVGSRSLPVGG